MLPEHSGVFLGHGLCCFVSALPVKECLMLWRGQQLNSVLVAGEGVGLLSLVLSVKH